MTTLSKYAELCEVAAEDETNTFNICIDENMTCEDIVQKILDIADDAIESAK